MAWRGVFVLHLYGLDAGCAGTHSLSIPLSMGVCIYHSVSGNRLHVDMRFLEIPTTFEVGLVNGVHGKERHLVCRLVEPWRVFSQFKGECKEVTRLKTNRKHKIKNIRTGVGVFSIEVTTLSAKKSCFILHYRENLFI